MIKHSPTVLTRSIATFAATLLLNASLHALTLTWNASGTANWDTTTNSWFNGVSSSPYIAGSDVVFQDLATPAAATANIASPVSPNSVTINNTTANPFTFTGAAITGSTGLTKTGSGTLVLKNTNSYTGTTTVSGGILELDAKTGTLSATSGVTLDPGATFRVTRDSNVSVTFDRNISSSSPGSGVVELNPHTSLAGTNNLNLNLTGTNSNFSGTLRLLAPAAATYRVSGTVTASGATPANVGTGSIEVQAGAQLFASASTFNNPIAISGIGFSENTFNYGALRMSGGTWAGNITVDTLTGARIGVSSGTANVTGSISGGALEVSNDQAGANHTFVFTGNNTYSTTAFGSTTNPTSNITARLNIGNNGTTGTLGTGDVTINGTTAAPAIPAITALAFDRSNGYTLGSNQAIISGGNATHTLIELDTRGTGFSDNGNAITLGTAGIRTGGTIQIAKNRANAIANISGALTAESVQVSAAQSGGVLNINPGATVSANYLSAGEGASGTINQASGSTVSVVGQLRVGNANGTSTYTMNGGTLTMTGASPANSPSTGTSGDATTSGDNNIDINPTFPTIIGGGIYLGLDGTGIFNHNNGTVTTNWIVLDNRDNTTLGIDQYNLNGGTLNLRSTYGLIQRNASAGVTFNGGTVRVDNTGTGTGTGANITIPLDANITTIGSTNTILDTNGSGNGFTLTQITAGSGGLTFTGGGTTELLAANLYTGATIVNSGSLVVTGSIVSPTTVNGGTLLGAGLAGSVLVNAGGTLAPGKGLGTLTASDVTFAGGPFALEINSASLADKLVVTGAVSLTSDTPLTLTLGLGYDPIEYVDSFVVINKTSAGPIDTTGGFFTYAGVQLREGATFVVSGQKFSISYHGGNGNDVVLSSVPEPTSLTALLGGCGVLLGLQRSRRRQ